MTECDILIEREKVEQVKEFVYLGSLFTNDGKHDRDIERRVNAGNKSNGSLLALMNSRSVSRQARLAIHNGVLIPTLMYVVKAGYDRRKMKSIHKRYDRSVVCVECLRKIDGEIVILGSGVV
ncbi:hypothetical protein EVAR_3643_1 [Eumeta japonica]|uniref:Uncharacterized protein n=1 Tax=Eumeta variegata TaxID=151549 RepID=A0A4C1SWK3_EUMVA|nr:hypothetical protein EVAR_3643_1 [Eumeta japonica]